MPYMTSGKSCAARNRCHRLVALWYNLHTIARIVTRERHPRVLSGCWCTVANVDSIGLVMRMVAPELSGEIVQGS